MANGEVAAANAGNKHYSPLKLQEMVVRAPPYSLLCAPLCCAVCCVLCYAARGGAGVTGGAGLLSVLVR